MSSDSQPAAADVAHIEALRESVTASFYAIKASNTTTESTCAFVVPKYTWLIDDVTKDAYMVTDAGLYWRAVNVQYGENVYVPVLAAIAATPGADSQSALAQLESIDRALNTAFVIEEAA